MSLVRDITTVLSAMVETGLYTGANLISTTTGVTNPIQDTTADVFTTTAGETTGSGRIIDRLRQPLGTLYDVVVLQAYISSTRGSTAADRKLTVGAKLLHGDSSGMGDAVEYSTGSRQSARQFFSTARTTDMLQWDGAESTGPVYAQSTPAYYDITGAKRYLQATVQVLKNGFTTETTGDEGARVGATLAFMAGAKIPQRLDTTGPYSTTTST